MLDVTEQLERYATALGDVVPEDASPRRYRPGVGSAVPIWPGPDGVGTGPVPQPRRLSRPIAWSAGVAACAAVVMLAFMAVGVLRGPDDAARSPVSAGERDQGGSATTNVDDVTDPLLHEYKEAVAYTLQCARDLGYEPQPVTPHPGGRMYTYAISMPPGGETPEMQAAERRCFDRELAAQSAVASRPEALRELREEFVGVLGCVGPHLPTGDSSAYPTSVEELEALSNDAAGRLDAEVRTVVASSYSAALEDGRAVVDCIEAVVGIETPR